MTLCQFLWLFKMSAWSSGTVNSETLGRKRLSRVAWFEYWADFTGYRDWSVFFSFRRSSIE
jgi:hypothetical protein